MTSIAKRRQADPHHTDLRVCSPNSFTLNHHVNRGSPATSSVRCGLSALPVSTAGSPDDDTATSTGRRPPPTPTQFAWCAHAVRSACACNSRRANCFSYRGDGRGPPGPPASHIPHTDPMSHSQPSSSRETTGVDLSRTPNGFFSCFRAGRWRGTVLLRRQAVRPNGSSFGPRHRRLSGELPLSVGSLWFSSPGERWRG